MWQGVKSHVALMQKHLRRFIDHFIDLILCRRAKIKLDTAMTFAAALAMYRVVCKCRFFPHVSLCVKIRPVFLKQFSM